MSETAATTLTRDELLKQLRALHDNGDCEAAHWEADQLLLRFLNDSEIRVAFEAVGRWYA